MGGCFVGGGSWVVGRGWWVVGRGSWVVGRGSWVVGGGWWVVGRGSWVVGRLLEDKKRSTLAPSVLGPNLQLPAHELISPNSSVL